MGRKYKYTKEVKLKAILDYKKGNKSMGQLCKELNCSDVSILAWIRGYRSQEKIFLIPKKIKNILKNLN